MSTTFGVNIKNGDQDEVVEVAFRSNGMRFTNDLAWLLEDDTCIPFRQYSTRCLYNR